MRRRVTYAFGGHFIAPHKPVLFLSYLGIPGESFWSSLGMLRVRVDVLAALFDAQAAQIRVGVLFYFLCKKKKDTLYFTHRLRTYASPGCGLMSWHLYLMRRLRRSASVAYFIFCAKTGTFYFMRRLRTYASSGCGLMSWQLYLMRRLRRSASVSYLNLFV